jgi:7-carboxy-7-deazaguanine synthase
MSGMEESDDNMTKDAQGRLPAQARLPKMPREADRLLINEFFYSIQGESTSIGRPCFFIRLSGCHLRCGYCDTEYAFHEGRTFSLDEVMARVAEQGANLVQITGGEPLLQRPVYPLMERLLANGYEVMLETSGSLDAWRVPLGVRRIFDVKTPGSGEDAANHWDNFTSANLRPEDEIKFIICSRMDYEWARDIVRMRLADVGVPLLFSPEWKGVRPRELAEWILADRLPVRFQVQMHKILWGDRPGV